MAGNSRQYDEVEDLMAELAACDLSDCPTYVASICGKDLTVGCVPARCGRMPRHGGECSILSESEYVSLDEGARGMFARLFPRGLPCQD